MLRILGNAAHALRAFTGRTNGHQFGACCIHCALGRTLSGRCCQCRLHGRGSRLTGSSSSAFCGCQRGTCGNGTRCGTLHGTNSQHAGKGLRHRPGDEAGLSCGSCQRAPEALGVLHPLVGCLLRRTEVLTHGCMGAFGVVADGIHPLSHQATREHVAHAHCRGSQIDHTLCALDTQVAQGA